MFRATEIKRYLAFIMKDGSRKYVYLNEKREGIIDFSGYVDKNSDKYLFTKRQAEIPKTSEKFKIEVEEV